MLNFDQFLFSFKTLAARLSGSEMGTVKFTNEMHPDVAGFTFSEPDINRVNQLPDIFPLPKQTVLGITSDGQMPVIDMDFLYTGYLEGIPLPLLVGSVVCALPSLYKDIRRSHPENLQRIFNDFEYAKQFLLLSICSSAQIEQGTSFMSYEDLSVYCRLRIPPEMCGKGEDITGNITVKDSIIKAWGTTFDNVYKIAQQNTEKNLEIKTSSLLENILKELDISPDDIDEIKEYLGEDFLESDGGIVLTNKDQNGYGCAERGAVLLFLPGVMEKLDKEFFNNNGFYIIPVDAHRWVLYEELGAPVEYFEDKINQNNLDLNSKNYLSSHLYHYDKESGFTSLETGLQIE